MDVELLIADPSGEKAYLPITEEGIEWSTERRSTPGKLTFKIVKDRETQKEIIEIKLQGT